MTLTPQQPTEELKNQLLFTNKELRRWQKLNMLVVDNRGSTKASPGGSWQKSAPQRRFLPDEGHVALRMPHEKDVIQLRLTAKLGTPRRAALIRLQTCPSVDTFESTFPQGKVYSKKSLLRLEQGFCII